ncbi:MAG: STAS domain-containing protein [Fibrobacteres bacterium]|nr:STAS domain-containing protein [Fibrobacterota bacterium]
MRIREIDNVVVVTVEKEIMQEDVETVQQTLNNLLLEKNINVVLDFAQCNYLTSMGLSVIFHAKKKMAEHGGDIRIARINTLITNLLEMTNLNKAMSIYGTVEEAVQSFNPGKNND